MHRGQELRVGIIPDAGFLVGSDVGRINSAERHVERETTSKGHTTRGGMAGFAVRRMGKILSARYQVSTGELRGDTSRVDALVIPNI